MALPNLSQISEALDKIMPELTPVPVGTVAYAHEVPTGWLQCNGAAVSRTTYARLFKKIGTKYGAGDGSTTFNLLDLHHLVLEGTNTPSEVAQKVEAGLPDITGEFNVVLDPLPPERSNFARTEHRAKRPQKDDLHPSRSVGDDVHGKREFLPVNRRHRRYFSGRVDPVQSFDGVVLDEARSYRKIEDFTASHDDALQRHLSICLEERLDDVDDERRGYLIDLFVLDVA